MFCIKFYLEHPLIPLFSVQSTSPLLGKFIPRGHSMSAIADFLRLILGLSWPIPLCRLFDSYSEYLFQSQAKRSLLSTSTKATMVSRNVAAEQKGRKERCGRICWIISTEIMLTTLMKREIQICKCDDILSEKRQPIFSAG